jgi:hypothetical protein
MNFKKIFAILALTASWIGVATAQSTTYRLNSAGNYSSVTNYANNCPAGLTCANYTTSMTQTGSFTLSSPVGANLVNATITPTAYSFSDGINTYSNTDAGSRINHFKLTTNGSGNITSTDIVLSKWLSVTNGGVNDRVSYFGSSTGFSSNNERCTAVSTSGGLNTCSSSLGPVYNDGGSSARGATAASITPEAPSAIPTLSEWALIFLASLMAMFAIRRKFRQ